MVEYIVPALTVIAPALACGVPRNCGNRSTRISVGELRGCSRSQLLLQWWNTLCQSLPCLWRHFQSCSQRQRLCQSTSGQCLLSQRRPLQLCAQPAPSTAYIAMLVSADGARDVVASHSVTSVLAAEMLRRHTLVCCCGSRDVAASHSQTGCCGSRDVAASHSQTAVAAAETLRRHAQRSLSGSKDVAASHSQVAVVGSSGVEASTFAGYGCGSKHVVASHSMTSVLAAGTLRRHTRRGTTTKGDTSEAYRGLGTEQPASCLSDGCSSLTFQCWDVSWPLKAWLI